MPTAIRPIGHEDRLALTDHLDELRTRLVYCVIALLIAFSVAVWQNDTLLDIINRPLERTTNSSSENGAGRLESTARSQQLLRVALQRGAVAFDAIARSESLKNPADQLALRRAIASYEAAIKALPTEVPGRQPVTLGVGEPLSTTLTVSFYFAALISLPFILFQLYAFVLPAFSPEERKVALPLMLMVPVLFILGVLFAYFVVVPPAIRFLQTFNQDNYDVLVQAKPYYSFVTLTLISIGILFQIPVGVLALTRAGIVTPAQLRKNRRYALVVIAVVAMLLPGTDPITMLLAMAPLLVLYEVSILLAAWLDRRDQRKAAAEPALEPPDPDPPTPDAV